MKKGRFQSRMEKSMTEYEKKRLSNLKLNAERMEAAGLGSMATKILASKYDSAAKGIMVEEGLCLDEMDSNHMLSEDREYQLSENGEEGGGEMDLVESPVVPTKGLKQQTSTMLELAMARRNRKKSSSSQQQTITREKDVVVEEEIVLMQNSPPTKECSRGQTMVEIAMAQKRKKLSPNQPEPVQKECQNSQNNPVEQTTQRKRQLPQQTIPKPKKNQAEINGNQAPQQQVPQQTRVLGKNDTSNGLHRSQVISPGSLAKYIQMRQRKHQSNGLELLSVALSTSLEGNERAYTLLDSTQHPSVELPPEPIMDNQDVPDHEANQDSTPKVADEKKHRGQTMMKKVHQRPFNGHRDIVLNEDGQPIGPSYDAIVEFRNFLGTLAKTHQYAPLNILDWKYMPTKENIWSCVKEKYIIPEEGKDSVLESVNDLWRVYKSRMKKRHFKSYETDELRWANRPSTIPDPEFRELLDYWSSPVAEEAACTNTANRQKHEDVHTLGPRSLARLRLEMKQNNPNKEPPFDSAIYQESRKRDPKRSYKTSGSKSLTNIEKMKNIQLQIEKGERDNNVDSYHEVVGKEHGGRTFLQGRGVKISRSKRKEKKGGYILDQEFFENMKANWTAEVTTTLASKILSQLQAANPQMNLVLPHFASISENPSPMTGEENMAKDPELHATTQPPVSLSRPINHKRCDPVVRRCDLVVRRCDRWCGVAAVQPSSPLSNFSQTHKV